MTGIPGLGGHHPQLQRALMDLADRAVAEETLAEDADPAAPGTTSSSPHPVPAPVPAPGPVRVPAEALIVELSDEAEAAAALLFPPSAEGAPSRAEGSPGPREGSPGRPEPGEDVTPRPGGAQQQVRGLPLDQLVAVLKRSGTDFKQAVRILSDIELDQPLPPKAVLRALWGEASAGTRTRPVPQEPEAATPPEVRGGPAAARPGLPAAEQPGPSGPREPARAVYDAPLDSLVRDRAWHRAGTEVTGPRLGGLDTPAVPTLSTVAQEQPANQAYVAALTTAEYQRLLVLLGEEVPEWFAEVRRSRGVRALLERRGLARLSVARFAGMRVGGWVLAAAGVAIAWVVGIRTGSWW